MSNELHTMPLMVEKLFSSRNVRNLRLDEFGAYVWLLGEAWLEGARLPSDLDEIFKSMPRGSEDPETRKRIRKFVLERFFHPSDDGGSLVNDTQSRLYDKIVAEMKAKSSHGKIAAERRWEKRDTPPQALINAPALPEQCRPNAIQSQSQSQSYIPLTGDITAPAPPAGDGYPAKIEEVIALATRSGVVMTEAQADVYLTERLRVDWIDFGGRKIKPSGVIYDVKKWALRDKNDATGAAKGKPTNVMSATPSDEEYKKW